MSAAASSWAPPLPALRRAAPVLPVVVSIALIGLPGMPEGGARPADAASGLVVLWALVRTARLARSPLTRTAAVVLGLPVLGIAVAAAGAPTATEGIAGMARYLQLFVLVPVAVVLLLRDRRDVRAVAWSVVGLALWEGSFGVYQYLTDTGALYQGTYVRAVGTFGPTDVMGMATVVSYGIVAATGLALGAPARRQRIAATLCAVALLVPLTVSFSRGSWIATAVTCGAQLMLGGMRRALKVFATAVAAGVVLVGGFGVGTAMLQERLNSITQVSGAPDQSVLDRYSLWAAAADMWRERPVTGVGLKAFPQYRDAHAPLSLSASSDTGGAGHSYQRQAILSPHNMYLLILSEEGLLGLLTVAGSWLALLVGGLRRLRRTRVGRDCAIAACGLLLWQLVDFAYADIGGASTTIMAVGFGLAAWWALAPGATTTPPAAREALG